MKMEGGAGGRRDGRKESLAETVSRFLNDENDPQPPPQVLDTDRIKRAAQGAALAGMVLTSSPAAAKEDPASENVTQSARTPDQRALDDLIQDLDRSPDQRALDQMIETIARSPIDAFGKESFTKQELKCLADNVYHEARGESLEGRYAVIFATLERVLHKRFPKTICGVVHQPWQFSWTKDKKILAQPINPRDYLKISVEVHELMKGKTLDGAAAAARMKSGLPRGAIFYKQKDFTGSAAVEKFFSTLVRVATIGTHNFFIERAEELKRFTRPASPVPSFKNVPLPRPSPQRRQRQAGRNPAS